MKYWYLSINRDLEITQTDCNYYNIFQSGVAKDVIRSLTQEINLSTCLTQLSHTPKEYAKGMRILLEQLLKQFKGKRDDIGRAHENIQKLSKVCEDKETALINLEQEIDKIQYKEIELNKNREEIFK